MSESRAAIVVENLSKSYPSGGWIGFLAGTTGRGSQALRDISFSVAEGETVGLLGPNGAGKTTLLKIIASLLYPSTGRVLVRGLDLVKESRRARAQIGLVTCDERSFYWRLTGRQNLEFFGKLYGLANNKIANRVQYLLEITGLADAGDRPFHGYSSGMKQKLAIARGLLSEPAVMLYDEPTRSLDPLSAQNIRRWIAENRRKSPQTAHLVATNQLQEAEMLCDRVIIINRGTMVAHGTIEEIRQRFGTETQTAHRVRFRDPGRVCMMPALDPAQGLLSIEEKADEETSEGDTRLWRVIVAEGSGGLSLALLQILGAGGVVLQSDAETVPFEELFCSIVERPQAPAAAVTGGGQ